ncbi:MAG: universal stress protein [Deltaproteobacteria bacterium]|nr:MAG: universal stress protein [Deltaproteobacteria bacterium]
MNTEKRVLFGVDDSEFSRQAITTVGSLLQGNENYKISVFYGAPDPNIPFLSKTLRLGPRDVEELERICNLEEWKVLEQIRESLAAVGFGADRVETICEAKCNDPADHMIKLAAVEGFETLALGRRGPARAERKLMGSVAYKLAHLADERAFWMIDPRVSSRDVLVALVGASIGRRVMEHAVRHFAHLTDSRFTFFHVIPPLPPQYWDDARILDAEEREERKNTIDQWMSGYVQRVEAVANEGRERLVEAGIPENNILVKVQVQDRGIARDIITEFERGYYGILVMGRKGFKKISQFRLGSKATKLLHAVHALAICLVN